MQAGRSHPRMQKDETLVPSCARRCLCECAGSPLCYTTGSIGHCFSAALHSERHRGLDGIVPCKLIVLVLACKKMKLWCLLVHEGASASARGRHFVIQQEAKWLALGTLSSYIQHIQFKCPMRFRFLKGRRGCCCECCGCCPGKEGGRG